MSSTPRGKGMGWASLYHVIPKSFSGLDTRDCFGISLYILSLHFWLRKDQGFAALFGIHVALFFWWCASLSNCKFISVMCIIFLSLLLNLNKWVIKVESTNCYALPLNFFKFPCFHLFKENYWDSISLLSSSPVWSIHSLTLKHQNDYLSCPNQNFAKLAFIPGPKFAFPLIPTKPPKNQIKALYFIPSLKSVFISVVSSPIDYLLLILNWREPSPVLIGLATRLSVVWCWPWILPFRPEVNLGSNKT